MFVCQQCGAAVDEQGTCPKDGVPYSSTSGDEHLGTQVGPYRLVRLLGVGGMGRVYRAVHVDDYSEVAIKVFAHDEQHLGLVERFFAEARAASVIDHPGIVHVMGVGRLATGRPYMVMEYVPGAPLSRALGVIDVPAGLLLIDDMLSALQAAHAQGIVHRDLKPENVIVRPNGAMVIVDFGIAKLTDPGSEAARTTAGAILGTPHYMSPEQAEGGTVDARTDIYATGVILFELVTGRVPFADGSMFQILRDHVESDVPSPRSFSPKISEALENVILTALAKSPRARFESCASMQTALASCPEFSPDARRYLPELVPTLVRPAVPRFDEFYSFEESPDLGAGDSAPTRHGEPIESSEEAKGRSPFRSLAWFGLGAVALGATLFALLWQPSASKNAISPSDDELTLAVEAPPTDATEQTTDAGTTTDGLQTTDPENGATDAAPVARRQVSVHPDRLMFPAIQAALKLAPDASLVKIEGTALHRDGRVNLATGNLDFVFLSPTKVERVVALAQTQGSTKNPALDAVPVFDTCAIRVRFADASKRPRASLVRFDCTARLPSAPCPLTPLLQRAPEELSKLGPEPWRVEFTAGRKAGFPSLWVVRDGQEALAYPCRATSD